MSTIAFVGGRQHQQPTFAQVSQIELPTFYEVFNVRNDDMGSLSPALAHRAAEWYNRNRWDIAKGSRAIDASQPTPALIRELSDVFPASMQYVKRIDEEARRQASYERERE